MLSIEEIKQSMGLKATQASYRDELIELLLDDIPYFYERGILTESFLTSAFSLRQLADHQFFIQQPSEKLNVTKLEGKYVVMGGQVNQYTEDAHGIFLPGSIDIGQDYLIRNRQSLRKIIKEGLGSGIGMRLEDHPELPMLGRLGSG